MSRYDYLKSKEIDTGQYPFYALIMAAMRKADSFNLEILKDGFPEVYKELCERYNKPYGYLESELEEVIKKLRIKAHLKIK